MQERKFFTKFIEFAIFEDRIIINSSNVDISELIAEIGEIEYEGMCG